MENEIFPLEIEFSDLNSTKFFFEKMEKIFSHHKTIILKDSIGLNITKKGIFIHELDSSQILQVYFNFESSLFKTLPTEDFLIVFSRDRILRAIKACNLLLVEDNTIIIRIDENNATFIDPDRNNYFITRIERISKTKDLPHHKVDDCIEDVNITQFSSSINFLGIFDSEHNPSIDINYKDKLLFMSRSSILQEKGNFLIDGKPLIEIESISSVNIDCFKFIQSILTKTKKISVGIINEGMVKIEIKFENDSLAKFYIAPRIPDDS